MLIGNKKQHQLKFSYHHLGLVIRVIYYQLFI